ncbi:ABC transporter ATP-binding protein [Clostridium sp. B9]|uniref:ABC transporter ATP-binding protein n=1 Tax=Clostridium sp. B9 TaxID=3423224 RepID=UPI003D2EF646
MMIQFNNVKYKGILSVNSLHIEEKKVNFIVGKSGGGKSTLLKLLNKIISPDNGEITYKEKNIEEIDSVELRKKIVMVPQNIIVFDGSVRENLLKGLELRKEEFASDEVIKEILDVVCLEKDLNENSSKLSGGEKQRLVLGRALLLNCEVLMLDEPTASLDEKTSEILIKNLIDFSKKRGISLVIITHNLKLAERYSERIIEVEKGKSIGE